jgi:hypothetical protein
MSRDKLQTCWQSQDWQIDPDNLTESMQRLDRSFSRTIFLRDVREIGVALVLIPVWIVMGIYLPSPWTWWLEIPALVWVAGFMFIDRRRQQRAAPAPGASLRAGTEYSLVQVEHQIWLLRNVLWWYLLPLGIPIALFFVHVAVKTGERTHSPLWQTVLGTAGLLGFLIGLYGFIHWLNQFAVRKHLGPLRERLQSALAALAKDEDVATGSVG